MRAIGVLFFTVVLILVGLFTIGLSLALSFESLQPQCVKYINEILSVLQGSLYYRLLFAGSGALLILISYSFAQLILSRFQREKTIAFATSSGEVTIALSAVEDLIRRLAGVMPEIKELRPDVIASKKGIIVDLRVVLRSEANIPELTSRLQDLTKSRIQEVLGVEEQIIIKIHVTKIALVEERERKKRELEKQETTIPFSGYGRV